jgi:hypothetical protein
LSEQLSQKIGQQLEEHLHPRPQQNSPSSTSAPGRNEDQQRTEVPDAGPMNIYNEGPHRTREITPADHQFNVGSKERPHSLSLPWIFRLKFEYISRKRAFGVLHLTPSHNPLQQKMSKFTNSSTRIAVVRPLLNHDLTGIGFWPMTSGASGTVISSVYSLGNSKIEYKLQWGTLGRRKRWKRSCVTVIAIRRIGRV